MSVGRLGRRSRWTGVALNLTLVSALIFAPISPSSAYPRQSEVQGKYLLDFVAVNTPGTRSPLTPAIADQLAQQVIYAFSQVAGEKIKFEKGKYLDDFASPVDIRTVTELKVQMAGKFRESEPGYKEIITIGVRAEDKSIPFAGQANMSDFVILNGVGEDFIATYSGVLFHEIGHNLKLLHANSIVCSGAIGEVSCDVKEYGDSSDRMGSYGAYIEQSPPEFRLSAANLDHLGLVDSNQIQVVDSNAEVTLTPVYPLSGSGVKLIYLPVYGRMIYAIEYRAATGIDSGLTKSKLDIFGRPGWTIGNVPSYGLQLRVIDPIRDPSEKLIPIIKPSDSATFGIETFVFASSHDGRHGFDPGAIQTLPDGSVINFISYDPASGAKIKITRPVDTLAPKVEISSVLQGDSRIEDGKVIEVMKGEGGTYKWPKVDLDLASLSDDRRVTELEVALDEKVIKTLTDPTKGKLAINANIEGLGKHVIKVKAKDAAGNFAESSRSLELKPYVIPAPLVEVNPSEISMQIVVRDQSATDAARDSTTYSLTNLSSGSVKNVDKSAAGVTKFEVTGLKRNSKLTFTVEGKDAFGNEGNTSTRTESVQTTSCDPKTCYVGIAMNYAELLWQYPAPKLRLQMQVKKKWVNLMTAGPYLSPNPMKDFPYAYNLNYAFTNTGNYYLRIYLDAYSYKGKKFSAYIGKPFWQKINS